MAWLGCSRNHGSDTACLLTALTTDSPRCLEVLRYLRPQTCRTGHFALGLVLGSSISLQAGWQSPPQAQAAITLAAGISCPLVGPSDENRRGFLVKQTRLGARCFQLTHCSFEGDHFAVVSTEVFQVRPSVFHSLAAWDMEEILFIGARALHVRKTPFFP